jgi:uncharacterized membrane protein required for colicin V production
MIMNILVIVFVGSVGYVWVSRGFFSALLHMCCTIAAGAIALGLWEPLRNLALTNLSQDWLLDIAPGFTLLLPFGLILATLTILANVAVRSNASPDGASNLIGGGICGLVTSVITAGIMVTSLSMIRAKPDFLQYEPLEQDKKGYITHANNLWVPVDKIVALAYGHMSQTTLRTSTPLASYYPDLPIRGHLMRMGPEESLLKLSAKPGDVQFVARYSIGAEEKDNFGPEDFLRDTLGIYPTADTFKNLDGEAPEKPVQLEGYVIVPKAGMKEKNGQVILGPGFVQLVVEDEDGNASTYLPLAMISQEKGESTRIGRWRFNGEKTFFASAGAAADQPIALEFIVPKGSRPLALFVKGLRLSLRDDDGEVVKGLSYSFPQDRDVAISSRALFSDALASAPLDTSTATPFRMTAEGAQNFINATNRVQVNNRSLVKGYTGGLQTRTDNNKTRVLDGENQFRDTDLFSSGMDRSLRVDEFFVESNIAVIQVNATPNLSPFDYTATDAEGVPTLIDRNGFRYPAIGYIYSDPVKHAIRYTPARPIGSIKDLPSITRSRTDQKITLIFHVSMNVQIEKYAVGEKVLQELTPPLKVDTVQVK